MQSMESQVSRARERSEGEIEISLSYVFHVLLRHWKRIASIVIGIGIVSALIFKFLVPKSYKAEALILPPSVEGVGDLGSLSRFLPGLGAATTPTAIVIGLINSRTVRAAVVETLRLDSIWKTKTFLDAVKKLEKAVEAYEDEDYGTIHITCVQRDPQLAATIVNTYIHVMETLNDSLKISVNKPFLKVVDWAIPPEKKWKPKPVLYSIIIMFFTFIFVVGWVFYRDMREPSIRDFYDFVKLPDKSGVIFREVSSQTLKEFVRELTLDLTTEAPISGWVSVLGLHSDHPLDLFLQELSSQLEEAGLSAKLCSMDEAQQGAPCLPSLEETAPNSQGLKVLFSKKPLENLWVGPYVRRSRRIVILATAQATTLQEVHTLLRLRRPEAITETYVGLWIESPA